MDVIDQAQADLARGDYTSARDRLYSALRTAPASQPVLELLAYTHLLMGDRVGAGAAWFLTSKEDDDPTASAAFAALEARHRSPISLAQVLPINAPSDYYPAQAKMRLDRLSAAVASNGQVWVPPRDTIYFDEYGVDADDFVDDAFPMSAGGASGRPLRQRILATLVIVAIAATSASVVLALVFS
ncbi:hypothetical protein HQ346_13745 [Rhodococcus sp. BP-252]|uniref:Uncharacterized protein n=1 Tax=Rhodococcoides kyotonense TaxID=398843 RepID=A0A177YGB7_9NOCA|nr:MULTISPECIES: DUF6584 family protein [Rhodococcus]MBY6412720.1 hypothetical protein [Rhodococcus sp. BP-320]MBY6417482.1 hypothetical protein [Rhodococcus sp. BP-321]MBY6421740.1 hypothetical protein [Rhodococcus sp. BP-324]MBY6427479.1 hypothetical protein [Rhodococcus sp. BP-323]MBY6432670.1 hypothetical protein [Rhodococcus sp. BP-322]